MRQTIDEKKKLTSPKIVSLVTVESVQRDHIINKVANLPWIKDFGGISARLEVVGSKRRSRNAITRNWLKASCADA